MPGAVKIGTGFPSASKAAKKLGVSKKVTQDLSYLADHSVETGEYVLPGVGRLVRVDKKRPGLKRAIRTNRVIKFQVAKGVSDALAQHKNK